jgi:MAP/microtubule affinity-regulating kinase
MHKSSNRKVALKIYEKYKLLDPQRKKSVRREIRLLEKINNNNIVKL